jgi:hypothetical protein
MDDNEERVWAYLLKNRQADAAEVALNTDTTEEFVLSCMYRISSPDWRDEKPAPEGKKFDDNKVRMDLLPPEMEAAVAAVLSFGANKYGDRNWEQGMRWGRPYAAMRRHMNAWWAGEENDPETGMPHTWHAACCVAFLIAYQSRGIGIDDRNKLEVFINARMAAEESTGSKVA